MTEQPVETMVVINIPTTGFVLTAKHRCDSCGARAYVQVWLHETPAEQETRRGPKELLFCGHHFNQHKTALWGLYMFLNDERHQLTEGIRDDHWVEGKPAGLPPRQKQPWEKP